MHVTSLCGLQAIHCDAAISSTVSRSQGADVDTQTPGKRRTHRMRVERFALDSGTCWASTGTCVCSFFSHSCPVIPAIADLQMVEFLPTKSLFELKSPYDNPR
jgi:hypothetical protein